MGKELGTAYHLLWNKCALLHMRWEEFNELFGKGEEEINVMNTVAPSFFRSVQDMFWEHMLLGLCRFTDRAKVASRRTLSLESLVLIPQSKPVSSLAKLVAKAREKTQFAHDWRNRRIAHNDFEHAIDESMRPLAHASRVDVKQALQAIHAALEAIDHHFTGSTLMFDGAGSGHQCAFLLRELKLITKMRAERWSRIKAGDATADDVDWEKWN